MHIHAIISRLVESAVGQLKQRFPGVSTQIDQLVRHGLSGQGLRWSAKLVNDHPHIDVANLAAVVKAAKKKKLDLRHYDSIEDLRGAVVGRNSIGEPVKKREATYLWDDGRYVVIYPHSRRAACHHGVNTSWCISRRDAENLWSHYALQGYIHYFVIDSLASRTNPYRKVAFSPYPSGDDSFYVEVTLADGKIFTKKLPPHALASQINRFFPGLTGATEIARRIQEHALENLPTPDELVDIAAREVEDWDKLDAQELLDMIEQYDALVSLTADWTIYAEDNLQIPTAEEYSINWGMEEPLFSVLAVDESGNAVVRYMSDSSLSVFDKDELQQRKLEFYRDNLLDRHEWIEEDWIEEDTLIDWFTDLWHLGNKSDKELVRSYFIYDPQKEAHVSIGNGNMTADFEKGRFSIT